MIFFHLNLIGVGNLPFDLTLSQADITQNGIAFPNTIDVVKGHDVMVKLLKTIRNQERCILRTPNFTMVDIAHKNDRYISIFRKIMNKFVLKLYFSEESNFGAMHVE